MLYFIIRVLAICAAVVGFLLTWYWLTGLGLGLLVASFLDKRYGRPAQEAANSADNDNGENQ